VLYLCAWGWGVERHRQLACATHFTIVSIGKHPFRCKFSVFKWASMFVTPCRTRRKPPKHSHQPNLKHKRKMSPSGRGTALPAHEVGAPVYVAVREKGRAIPELQTIDHLRSRRLEI
jgi:hypothetical protein